MNDLDAASIRALYDEHGAALWRYAVRLTGDRAHAEDVAQETLLRAWQHPEVFNDGERSERAWLFTVARNMIIDERRSLRFRNEACELDYSIVIPHRFGVATVFLLVKGIFSGLFFGAVNGSGYADGAAPPVYSHCSPPKTPGPARRPVPRAGRWRPTWPSTSRNRSPNSVSASDACPR